MFTITFVFAQQTDSFTINNHDGKITVNGPLDFEKEQRYTLFVTAKVRHITSSLISAKF